MSPNIRFDSKATKTKTPVRRKGTSSSGSTKFVTQESYQELSFKVEQLNEKARAVNEHFDALERKMERHSNHVFTIVVGIAVAMFVTFIVLVTDYYHYGEERYVRIVDMIYEAQDSQEIYSKEEIDKMFSETEDTLIGFKNCIWHNGLTNCLR
jgi:hypothetical protein